MNTRATRFDACKAYFIEGYMACGGSREKAEAAWAAHLDGLLLTENSN